MYSDSLLPTPEVLRVVRERSPPSARHNPRVRVLIWRPQVGCDEREDDGLCARTETGLTFDSIVPVSGQEDGGERKEDWRRGRPKDSWEGRKTKTPGSLGRQEGTGGGRRTLLCQWSLDFIRTFVAGADQLKYSAKKDGSTESRTDRFPKRGTTGTHPSTRGDPYRVSRVLPSPIQDSTQGLTWRTGTVSVSDLEAGRTPISSFGSRVEAEVNPGNQSGD